MDQGHIVHVERAEGFKDEHLLYRFKEHEIQRGPDIKGEPTWQSVLPALDGRVVSDLAEAQKSKKIDTDFPQKSEDIPPLLFDEHNCDLFD
jgi:hypothetical protein